METTPTQVSFRRLFRWGFWRRVLLIVTGILTVVALFFAEENWRGKHAWESYKLEMEGKGVIFDYAKFVPPTVPDDQNFAMTPFFAAFFDFVPGTQKPRDTNVWQRSWVLILTNEIQSVLGRDGWPNGKPLDLIRLANECVKTNGSAPARFASGQTQEAARAILEYLKPVDPILDELRKASQRPFSRFNIAYDWDSKFSIVLVHLAPLSQVCSRCELRAASELELGQADAAFEDVKLMLYLLGTTRSEPFLITQIIRASWVTKALQPIYDGLTHHQWTDAQLAEFDKQLQELDFLNDAIRSLRAEQTFCDPFFAELRSDPDAIEEVENLGDAKRDKSSDVNNGPPFWLLVPRGWFYFEQLNYHRFFADEVNGVMTSTGIDPEVADRKDDVLATASSESIASSVLHHRLLSRALLPALSTFEFKMTRAQTYVNLARIACALERYRLAHGQYPDALDVLVPQFLAAVPRDVIMDQPLRYRRADDAHFILYSVGWNKKDDGGVPPAKESEERTKGDWVWASDASDSK